MVESGNIVEIVYSTSVSIEKFIEFVEGIRNTVEDIDGISDPENHPIFNKLKFSKDFLNLRLLMEKEKIQKEEIGEELDEFEDLEGDGSYISSKDIARDVLTSISEFIDIVPSELGEFSDYFDSESSVIGKYFTPLENAIKEMVTSMFGGGENFPFKFDFLPYAEIKEKNLVFNYKCRVGSPGTIVSFAFGYLDLELGYFFIGDRKDVYYPIFNVYSFIRDNFSGFHDVSNAQLESFILMSKFGEDLIKRLKDTSAKSGAVNVLSSESLIAAFLKWSGTEEKPTEEFSSEMGLNMLPVVFDFLQSALYKVNFYFLSLVYTYATDHRDELEMENSSDEVDYFRGFLESWLGYYMMRDSFNRRGRLRGLGREETTGDIVDDVLGEWETLQSGSMVSSWAGYEEGNTQFTYEDAEKLGRYLFTVCSAYTSIYRDTRKKVFLGEAGIDTYPKDMTENLSIFQSVNLLDILDESRYIDKYIDAVDFLHDERNLTDYKEVLEMVGLRDLIKYELYESPPADRVEFFKSLANIVEESLQEVEDIAGETVSWESYKEGMMLDFVFLRRVLRKIKAMTKKVDSRAEQEVSL